MDVADAREVPPARLFPLRRAMDGKAVHPPGLKPDREFWYSTDQQFAGLPDDLT